MMRFVGCLALLCFWVSPVLSQEMSDYYSAMIPVTSQSATERKRAASIGLKEVLIRVSGSQNVLLNERLFGAIESAIGYVDQFQYQEIEVDEQSTLVDFNQEIILQFSPTVIEKLLRDAQQRFWPINRPKTLVWLVEDNIDYGRQLLNQDNAPEMVDLLKSIGWERGLSLSFPFLDLDDNIALPAERAWRFDEQAIIEASKRYDADVILIGRYLTTSRGEIRSTWQYWHGQENRIYDYDSLLEQEEQKVLFARQVLYPLADFLAEKYSILPRSTAEIGVVMLLDGIDSFADYRQSLDYLDGLAAVESVKVTSIKMGSMLLVLNTDTALTRIQNTLELHKKLQDQNLGQTGWNVDPLGSFENPLRYRWM